MARDSDSEQCLDPSCGNKQHAVTRGITSSALADILHLGWWRAQILFQVFSGARPHMPEGLPAGYARLITDCWARDPAARPSFPAVHARLAALHAQLVACPRQQGSPGGGARAPADP